MAGAPERQTKKAPRAPGTSFNEYLRSQTQRKFPDVVLVDKSEWLGDAPIPADRYVTREAHELEKQKIWKKVWQMACREEEIPEVGDALVYDITGISILIVRSSETELKAFYNICLHQGRQLREGITHNKELRCPFHAFTWNLDGSFMGMPSRWDFPQIDRENFPLKEVKVGRWGGFVFINMDPQCESLESFMGDFGDHWQSYPLDERYIAAHVRKIFPANWKLVQEAFMEGYHNVATHSQFNIPFGGLLDSTQYDAFGNYSRAFGLGAIETAIGLTDPTLEECIDCLSEIGAPGMVAAIRDKNPKNLEEVLAIAVGFRRERLRVLIGDRVDELSDIEINGGGYFTLFPNFHPWWAFDEIVYRFRPLGNDPERCIMDTWLLRPFKGERPKPAATTHLGVDDSHLDAVELGELARIFHQDELNIPLMQKGMHTMYEAGVGAQHGVYQSTKIRHFHKLWEEWTSR
jgi:nitrite reductase/ring-hydroxylating ferredoxin subunit